MKKLLFYVCLSLSLCLLSFTSKEENERQQTEKEVHVQDSFRVENERNREDSIRTAKRIETIKNSIKIKGYHLSSPNSVGGVGAFFHYKNLSDKTIKYFVWTGYPINAVGDPVSCTVRGYSLQKGEATGPIKKGASRKSHWDCIWYNWQAEKLILTKIEIEYMDGSTLEIEGDELYLIGKKKEK